ncbi:hypothetical protein GCM10027088_47860 [Nocardia goodfellowii]
MQIAERYAEAGEHIVGVPVENEEGAAPGAGLTLEHCDGVIAPRESPRQHGSGDAATDYRDHVSPSESSLYRRSLAAE